MMNRKRAQILFLHLLVLLLGSGQAHARSIHEKVARFYLRQAVQSALVLESGGGRCDPVKPAGKECIQYVAGEYASQADRMSAARVCIGNLGLDCARYVAGEYASREDRVKSARSCSRVSEVECVKYIAGDYAGRSDRTQAAEACKNSDLSCIRGVVGSYPSRSERIQAARACAGEEE